MISVQVLGGFARISPAADAARLTLGQSSTMYCLCISLFTLGQPDYC